MWFIFNTYNLYKKFDFMIIFTNIVYNILKSTIEVKKNKE